MIQIILHLPDTSSLSGEKKVQGRNINNPASKTKIDQCLAVTLKQAGPAFGNSGPAFERRGVGGGGVTEDDWLSIFAVEAVRQGQPGVYRDCIG